MLWGKRLEPVRFGDRGTLAVRCLLMLFVMAMIGVYNVGKLPNLLFEVNCLDSGIMEMGLYRQRSAICQIKRGGTCMEH